MTAAQQLERARADVRRLLVQVAEEERKESWIAALQRERGHLERRLAATPHDGIVTISDPLVPGGTRERPASEIRAELQGRLSLVDAELEAAG